MRYGFIGCAALTLALAACDNGDAVVVSGAAGTHKVNGSLSVAAGEHTGSLSTVNGSVDIGANAVVTTVQTVNGPVEMAEHATADAVSAVNGPVSLAGGARVNGGITTVNGTIDLAAGADVGGTIKNVNGAMTFNAAHVGGGLRTVGADIDLGRDSHVEGGIVVRKASNWFGASDARRPRIIIGPGSVVQGDLRFEREVQLYVSDRASIGPVTGATAVRYSGDKPPG
jgi:hypothetical protein